ncbi:hypothetical protein ACE418_02950 [Megasphaera sp. WILCCON 0056]|uniref:hypothetical protein n=1 Tax=Megasphaera sp. WILCCON 0056 TaxID=3345340 RepID=UPI003A803EB0
MSKCMVCGEEFEPYYKAQRLCQSCLDKFTKRYWDWNEYRKKGNTRRPTCIVCDKPMTSGFSVCPNCRDAWKKIYYQIMRPKTIIQARNRMARNRDTTAFESRPRTALDDDIAAARKAGLSYGAYMVRKKGLIR